jgi:hypothetical protein
VTTIVIVIVLVGPDAVALRELAEAEGVAPKDLVVRCIRLAGMTRCLTMTDGATLRGGGG